MGKRFPPFRSCVPSLQTPACGVFGLTSERKAPFRSNTGAGEASGTQAGHRTPSPPVLGSPPPGLSCSWGIFFSLCPSFSSGPFSHTKQKRKVLSRLFLCGRHHRVGEAVRADHRIGQNSGRDRQCPDAWWASDAETNKAPQRGRGTGRFTTWPVDFPGRERADRSVRVAGGAAGLADR